MCFPLRLTVCLKGTLSLLHCYSLFGYSVWMKFSDHDLQEFIAIYQEEFGETLSFAEASEMAFRLVNLYMQLTKALPSEQKDASSGVAIPSG